MEVGSYRGDQQDKKQDYKKFSDWLAPVAATKNFDEEDYCEAEVGAVLVDVAVKGTGDCGRCAPGAERDGLGWDQECQEVC